LTARLATSRTPTGVMVTVKLNLSLIEEAGDDGSTTGEDSANGRNLVKLSNFSTLVSDSSSSKVERRACKNFLGLICWLMTPGPSFLEGSEKTENLSQSLRNALIGEVVSAVYGWAGDKEKL